MPKKKYSLQQRVDYYDKRTVGGTAKSRFFAMGYIDGTSGINNWSLVGDGSSDKMKEVYKKGLTAGAKARIKSHSIKF